MKVKKSSLIFFLYALVMFWPDYFFFGMIKYLENLLAAYAIIYVYNSYNIFHLFLVGYFPAR